MSLSEAAHGRRSSLASRIMTVAGATFMLAGVAGCTVTPLYGTSTASISSQESGGATAGLASVEVTEAYDRVGQEVRNHLIFMLAGGRGQPTTPVYRLQLATSAYASQGPSVSVTEVTLRPTAGFVTVRGDYTLTETASGRVVSAGTRAVQAHYDIPGQNYAAQRAVRDAENRGARELAEVLRLAVAQELERATSTAVPDVVLTPEDVDRRRDAETGSFPRPAGAHRHPH